MNVNETTVLIYDNGSAVELARMFVGRFKKVYYFTPFTQSGFPDFNPRFIGEGIKGVDKVEHLWKLVDSNEVDLYIFLDVYDGDLASHLKSIGKKVVSAFYGGELELNRTKFQEFLKANNLPVSEFTPIIGITTLRKELSDKKDKFIKISNLRGISETLKYENSVVSSSEIDDLSYRLGDLREVIEFLIQNPIGDDRAVEWGWESFFTGGDFNETILIGCEVKDCAYYGRFMDIAAAPPFVATINNAFKPALSAYGYQTHFSTEVRQVDPQTGYFTDATCRKPAPPGELMYYLIENIDEVYQGLAQGINVPFKKRFEFGVQIIIHSEWGEDHFLSVEIPEQYRDNVFLKNYAIVDGVPRIIPQPYKLQEVGAVVAGGNTLEEAIGKVKEIIEAIKNRNLSFPVDKLEHIQEELDKMDKLGINFFKTEKLQEEKKEPIITPEVRKQEPKAISPKVKKFLEKIQR